MITPSDSAFLDTAAGMPPNEMQELVEKLVAHNDIRRLRMMLQHGINMHGTDAYASRKALAMGNRELFVTLVECGASLKYCETAMKPDAVSRRLYLMLHQLPEVKFNTAKNPDMYEFVKGYSAQILLNGIMSPPYTEVKMPLLAWALCLEPPITVFEKMAPHLELTDEVFPGLTYRGLIEQLGLKQDYQHFEAIKRMQNRPVKQPLKRRAFKP